jgi:hypothetical protein
MLDALCSMLYATLPPHIQCGMAYVHVPCAMCHVPCAMCLAAEELGVLGAAGFVVVVVVVVVALWCVVRGAVCVLAIASSK